MPRRKPLRASSSNKWASARWKAVDMSGFDLGEFDEAVFVGLEELDGDSYQNDSNVEPRVEEMDEVAEHSGDDDAHEVHEMDEPNDAIATKPTSSHAPPKSTYNQPGPLANSFDNAWDGITLNNLLVQSLIEHTYTSPTPIQRQVIPAILRGKDDIVGAAETGTGKTLAFCLPILHSLLHNWRETRNLHSPYSIILTPTRELAMQITSVLREITSPFKSQASIETVLIVGGMSEQKQKRQLNGRGKPVHILVATPGRLCELLDDEDAVALENLRSVRFLVVDEADRMVEDGHFPELFKIFSRIKEHEQGPKVFNHLEDDDDAEAEEAEALGEEPQDSNLELVGEKRARNDESKQKKRSRNDVKKIVSNRQTLLFSATATSTEKPTNPKKHKKATAKMVQAGKLSESLRRLLDAVGVQANRRIIDTTLSNAPAATVTEKAKQSESIASALPKALVQMEVKVPLEDKDIFAYYFILKHPGRTLLFVNSIKSARRVEGLLRTLNVNCRCLHAQKEQKQRVKALEAFGSSPISVLVATDVAARGLDVSKVQYVLHYDIARTPQVYVHRSGRTARAANAGTTISFVSPEDAGYHAEICTALGVPALPTFKPDVVALDNLRERVRLARRIFSQSFEELQVAKQKNWAKNSAKHADILVEDLDEFVTYTDQHTKKKQVSKRQIEQDRAKLQQLLLEPFEQKPSAQRYRKNAFVVFAK